jgi:hypothetical protein
MLTMPKSLLLGAAAFSALAGQALAGEAQSIGVNLTGGGNYLIAQTKTYQFDPVTAAGFYTNAPTSGPAIACSNQTRGTCDSNQPPTPPAPNPDPGKLAQQAIYDECQFAIGGFLGTLRYAQRTLDFATRLDDPTLPVDAYRFTWIYTVAPASSSPVPALTAWDLVSTAGGGTTARVTLGATIESVSVSSHFATGKYSFALASTLSPGVPDQMTNSVSGLVWTIRDAKNNVVASQAVGSTVVDNKPGSTPYDPTTGALDFSCTANAGTFGKASNALMDSNNSATATGTSPSDHVPGDARSILNGGLQNGTFHDTFTPNDDGGADGSDLSYAMVSGITQNLGAGTYTVTLTGNVAGRAASLPPQSFSVTNAVKIITPGCGSSPQ